MPPSLESPMYLGDGSGRTWSAGSVEIEGERVQGRGERGG